MKVRATTESGSVYLIDADAKVMRRTRGKDSDPLDFDGEPIPFDVIDMIEIGTPINCLWQRHGRMTWRCTTPVTEVVHIVDSA